MRPRQGNLRLVFRLFKSYARPRIRLNNLKTSLRFPCLGFNPNIDSVKPMAAWILLRTSFVIVLLLLCSHSPNDIPPNLSGTYPYPRYGAPWELPQTLHDFYRTRSVIFVSIPSHRLTFFSLLSRSMTHRHTEI